MKYGVAFGIIAVLFAFWASFYGGWFWFLIWPAISFGIVSAAYFGLGPRVFGKRIDGSLLLVARLVLLPYLVLLYGVWHGYRLFSREPACQPLFEGVYLSRRLLPHELPADVRTVVDLTCEFSPLFTLPQIERIIFFPMLDATAAKPQQLASLAKEVSLAGDGVLIHCAQGHGRTGLVAAALLIATARADSAEAAIDIIQSIRPGVSLNQRQTTALVETATLLLKDRET